MRYENYINADDVSYNKSRTPGRRFSVAKLLTGYVLTESSKVRDAQFFITLVCRSSIANNQFIFSFWEDIFFYLNVPSRYP